MVLYYGFCLPAGAFCSIHFKSMYPSWSMGVIATVISNILVILMFASIHCLFPLLVEIFLDSSHTYSRYLEMRLWDFFKFFGECFLLFCFSRQLTQTQATGSNLPFSVGFGSNVSPVCSSTFGIIPALHC